MATKNNFSKAVLDLMGLQGNEDRPVENVRNTDEETVFDQKNIKAERGQEMEKEITESESEMQGMLYNAKMVSETTVETTKENSSVTVISSSMVIVGEITSGDNIEVHGDVRGSIKTDGDITVSGNIIGDIAANSISLNGSIMQGNITAKGDVTIGPNTVVVGDIIADNIKLNGKMKGNLKINKISEFHENALLAGDVYSQTISMSKGARLHGNVSVAFDSKQSEKEFDSIFGMIKER